MSGSAASALTVDEADDAAAAGVVRLAGFARAVGVVQVQARTPLLRLPPLPAPPRQWLRVTGEDPV